jgi:hypothetical protein
MTRQLIIVLLLCSTVYGQTVIQGPPRIPLNAAGASTLLNNLVAYWKLDEASGNTRADSVGGNTLSESFGSVSTASHISNAAQFVAADDDALTATDSASLSLNGTDWTIALWARRDSDAGHAGYEAMVQKQSGDTWGNLEWGIFYDRPNSRFEAGVSNGGSGFFVFGNTSSVSNGTWYFVVVKWNNSTQTLSISLNNGTFNDQTIGGQTIQDGGGQLRIGSDRTASGPTNFAIDEVGIWKRILTADELTALYNSGSGTTYPFE